ncbi:hypothetical protein Naga_100778g2 [Nannochloropsis gaditana]|uniref:Uncharacterized protein n=1 Tax=Nannochloropsis gaditana TaxID=72520 RepID=W7TJ17_9STRA|nr:hypothetical protein Naga_100778g2 [Nannochloropsis gaditana]
MLTKPRCLTRVHYIQSREQAVPRGREARSGTRKEKEAVLRLPRTPVPTVTLDQLDSTSQRKRKQHDTREST